MLLLIVACAKPPSAVDTGLIDSGGRETGDAGGSNETGDGSGFDPPSEPGPCGRWAGVQGLGTSWTFVPTAAYVAAYGFDGSYNTTVTSVADEVTLQTEGRYDSANGYITWTRTDIWRCDEYGAWFTHSDASSSSLSGTDVITQSGWRDFDPGWLIRPAALDVGTTWTDDFTYTSEVNGAPQPEAAVHCDSSVTAAETRTLPIATLDTLKLDATCDNIRGPDGWLAEYVGLVETGEELLSEFVP